MTLTQQFILVSLLPATFLFLALYSWRARLGRPALRSRWLLALLTAAVWASSILSYYGGATMPAAVAYTWRVVGIYALSLLPVWLLAATFVQLVMAPARNRLAVGLAALLWLVALVLDPAWGLYRLPDFVVAGQTVRHFDLWGAVWITSWLLPAVVAWLVTQQAASTAPGSLYRNQANYWLLAISLLILGSSLGLTRELPFQQTGALIAILGGLVGVISLVRSQLPDLQLVMRRLMSRFLAALLVFGLAWLSLWYMIESARSPADRLGVAFPAALFTLFFITIYYLADRLLQRLAMLGPARRAAVHLDQNMLTGGLWDPVEFAQLALRLTQSRIAVDDAWLMVVEEGPAGKLLLRPVASLDENQPEPVVLAANSPFMMHLRRNTNPLIQFDIDTLGVFDSLPAGERETISRWQRAVFVPLHAGERLLGVMGLAAKYSGEPYERYDLLWLQELASQLGAALVQAGNLSQLRRINDYVFQQNQTLLREKRYLHELTTFYADFLGLLSPDLRRPFATIERELELLQQQLTDSNGHRSLDELHQHFSTLKALVNNLIAAAGRVQKNGEFQFEPVHMDEVARAAVRNLGAMAEARRVKVELAVVGSLRPVYGDQQRLVEAVQHLLHNAIKFNKIGGQVRLECALENNELSLHVIDNGVGMPAERLENVLKGFTGVENLGGGVKGSGMGIPLSRFIVHAHGGRLEATSKHGSGSTYSIYLPVALGE